MIVAMSRWTLAFLAFTFFIFTPTVVYVCGTMFHDNWESDGCLHIPLISESVMSQGSTMFVVDLPVWMMTMTGVVLFAAAFPHTLRLPRLFTLLPQTPPPR